MNFDAIKFIENIQKIGKTIGLIKNYTDDEFFNSEFIVTLLNTFQKDTTLLRPVKSEIELSPYISKFGGIPNLKGFSEYPKCSECNNDLNFTLQLYKADFPEMYFPINMDLFQLFRCPNYNCSHNLAYKGKFPPYIYYFNSDNIEKLTYNTEIPNDNLDLNDIEPKVIECKLNPEQVKDFIDCNDDAFFAESLIEKKFNSDLSELFYEKYFAIKRSKINGYPSFCQWNYYPLCKCGNKKELFLQLSSNDLEGNKEHPTEDNEQWSPHGIMIVDVGNLYYFVCKSCGIETIESHCDF